MQKVPKGGGKGGHIVAETMLLMTFPCVRKLGNICCEHKMFLNKIRNIFCVPDTKFVSATNVARTGKRGNICAGNNVSATICPRLPGPLDEAVEEFFYSFQKYFKLAHSLKHHGRFYITTINQ